MLFVKFFLTTIIIFSIKTIFRCLSFVFPYGASLNVAKPAAPILTSGSVAYPLNRPLCAFYSSSTYSNGGIIKNYLITHKLHIIFINILFTFAHFLFRFYIV